MKLSELCAKPKLVEVVIDDAETIEKCGSSIEYWTWDRHSLTTFVKFASIKKDDMDAQVNVVKSLVLDENGTEIISDDNMPSTAVLTRVFERVSDELGK